jgi:hypothetical protein
MGGGRSRATVAVAGALLLLAIAAPVATEGATGGEGTISPWSGVVGDPISIEIGCPDGMACGSLAWTCRGPRTAEVGFRPVGQPSGDPPGYGSTWALATADPTGRRFQSNVPAIEPGPYSVSLRCDAGEPLHIAGPGFGASDGPFVDFAVIPLVRPGSLAAVWLDACEDQVVDLWISATPDVTRPDDRRLTPVRIVRQSSGREATWLSVARFKVPSVAPGEYFAYVRLGGEPDCYPDRETGAGVSFAPVAVPAAGAGFAVFMDPAPSLIVHGLPDSAAAGPPGRGYGGVLLATAVAFLLGAIVSLRRIGRPAGGPRRF